MAPRRRPGRSRAAVVTTGFQPAELEALPAGPAVGQQPPQGLVALDAELLEGQEILGIQTLVARIYGQLQHQRPINWSFEARPGDYFCSTLTITHDGSSFMGEWTVGKRHAMRSAARAAWKSLRALELGLEVEDPTQLPRGVHEGIGPVDGGPEETAGEPGAGEEDQENASKEDAHEENGHEEVAVRGKDAQGENDKRKPSSVDDDDDTEYSLRFLAGEFDHFSGAYALDEDRPKAAPPVRLSGSKRRRFGSCSGL